MDFVVQSMDTKTVLIKWWCREKKQKRFKFGPRPSSLAEFFCNWILAEEAAPAGMLPSPLELKSQNFVRKACHDHDHGPWTTSSMGPERTSFNFAVVLSKTTFWMDGETNVDGLRMFWMGGMEEVGVVKLLWFRRFGWWMFAL